MISQIWRDFSAEIAEIKNLRLVYRCRRSRLFARILDLRSENRRVTLDLNIENLKCDGDGRKLAARQSKIRGELFELTMRYQIMRDELRTRRMAQPPNPNPHHEPPPVEKEAA